MISIAVFVIFGTVLIVFGQEFARSAGRTAKKAIVENLTGDLVLYSSDSKEKPSSLSWSSPLSTIRNMGKIKEFLQAKPEIGSFTAYTQNIAIVSVQNDQQREIPFIFTAVEPESYLKVFDNFDMKEGDFFGAGKSREAERGIVVSDFQNRRYREVYNVSLNVGDTVTLETFLDKFEKEGAGLEFRVERWDEASGGFARVSSFLGVFIFGASGLIFLVVALIIMNTLIINVAAGIVGVIISSALIGLFSGKGISLPPVIAQFLIGGGKLFLSFEPALILQALVVIVLISVVATLYPLRIATRVTPLKAMAETMQ